MNSYCTSAYGSVGDCASNDCCGGGGLDGGVFRVGDVDWTYVNEVGGARGGGVSSGRYVGRGVVPGTPPATLPIVSLPSNWFRSDDTELDVGRAAGGAGWVLSDQELLLQFI